MPYDPPSPRPNNAGGGPHPCGAPYGALAWIMRTRARTCARKRSLARARTRAHTAARCARRYPEADYYAASANGSLLGFPTAPDARALWASAEASRGIFRPCAPAQ
jgi:hypothetical protein